MRQNDVTEFIGIGLLLIAFVCMGYALWVVRGPAAWFGVGALLMLVGFVLIGIANREPE